MAVIMVMVKVVVMMADGHDGTARRVCRENKPPTLDVGEYWERRPAQATTGRTPQRGPGRANGGALGPR
eukprot:4284953-Pyramimonas_sp.AAC.1